MTLMLSTCIACRKDPSGQASTQEEVSPKESGVMEKIAARKSTLLLVCGSNMVYLIDAAVASEKGYKAAILWQWNATAASGTLHLDASRLDHLDDCKPVDDGKKLLVTSSYNWAVLLDIETKEILWFSKDSRNAHSAELLPDNRIAVACSTGDEGTTGNCIQLFSASKSGAVLCHTPFESAHGVVWHPASGRLYAGGKTSLNCYKLEEAADGSISLAQEKSVKTSSYVTGVHDLTLVDSGTLLLAGKKAALYSVSTGKFTSLDAFAASTALKSVNYNPATKEAWYTDATEPEGDYSWSSHKIRHTSDVFSGAQDRTISIPDINMYKVRVYRWEN